ncbi:MAG: hypothetical protein ACYDB1_11945 [Acidiferrobacteraceae bacterium]
MALIFSFISVLAVFVAAAQAKPPVLCPSAHIAKGPPGMPNGCDCASQIERLWPKGTRVYAYDQYVVFDGHRDVHFSIEAKFWCGPHELHVYDAATRTRESFSLGARIVRWKDAKEVAVFPSKPMTAQLKRDIAEGLAYYKTTVKSK